MIPVTNQIFRITYEAFSKFSNGLNRCRTFGEIAECLNVHLKYLFNYHVFRASYQRNGNYVHLMSANGKTGFTAGSKPAYLEYEKVLFSSTVPRCWTDEETLDLNGFTENIQDENLELWGWNFQNDERQIIVSVLGGSRKSFSRKDINFLKLVSDHLETKMLELCLIAELNEKNTLINLINENQKEIIDIRTREIAAKNKALIEISVQNAHSVREPLSRILGLTNLLDDDCTQQLLDEVIPLIKLSANDLDNTLRNVINNATSHLSELKV